MGRTTCSPDGINDPHFRHNNTVVLDEKDTIFVRTKMCTVSFDIRNSERFCTGRYCRGGVELGAFSTLWTFGGVAGDVLLMEGEVRTSVRIATFGGASRLSFGGARSDIRLWRIESPLQSGVVRRR